MTRGGGGGFTRHDSDSISTSSQTFFDFCYGNGTIICLIACMTLSTEDEKVCQ